MTCTITAIAHSRTREKVSALSVMERPGLSGATLNGLLADQFGIITPVLFIGLYTMRSPFIV